MEQQRLVSIKLPLSLIAALEKAAHAGEVSPAEVIRATLKHAFPPKLGGETEAQKAGEDLRAVRKALATARGWLDLQARLRTCGFVLRPENDRLLLCTWPIEVQILPIEVLGTSLARLTMRYRAPFPGFLPGPICEVPVFRSLRASSEGTPAIPASEDMGEPVSFPSIEAAEPVQNRRIFVTPPLKLTNPIKAVDRSYQTQGETEVVPMFGSSRRGAPTASSAA
ncbi:CopG family transcriptional regulator [Albirhodobacter sp. R86504]|uniref:ribbon-helix-helix domain-containing protein n=1 Tax=Albirhodobacter sp. R86504 TaxID=3093848 RepID=UPI00366C7F8A